MTQSLPQLDQAFYEHLTMDDALGVVVRAHIHIEASLTEFVEALIPRPEKLPRLTYAARLRLAVALGLREDYFEALLMLGELRNQFAHKLDAQLDDAVVTKLYTKLPLDGREITLKSYDATNKQRGDGASRPPFDALVPQDRFVLIAVVLKGMTAAAVHHAKHDVSSAPVTPS